MQRSGEAVLDNGLQIRPIPVVLAIFVGLACNAAHTSAKRYEALQCVKSASSLEYAKTVFME